MKIGLQLYTLRDALNQNPVETLARVADMGYRYVETAGLAGLSAEAFRVALDKHGLTATSSHHGLEAFEEKFDETVKEAKVLGVGYLVLPWVQEQLFRTQPEFGQRLGKVADRLAGQGLKFAYHNHAFEFEPVGARPAYELLWEHAPEGVLAELDLYWCQYGGHDPVCWLDTLEHRVPLTHFKDGRDGKFTPVGEGDLDWEAIIPVAREAGVKYAIVELDESPRDPFDCVKTSREFLSKMGVDG
ncbi:MAG: sugar phosphate isomerase/epimerase family protein [Fimbriimonadaceae bacterium]